MNTPTLQEVLDQLSQEQHLSGSHRESIFRVLAEIHPDAPWFVQVLSVVGGWIAAIMLFVSALFCVPDVDESSAGILLVISGIVIGGVAFFIRIGVEDWISAWGGAFADTFAMVFAIVGQIMVTAGIAISADSVDAALVAALILQGIFLIFYPGRVLRFLSWITIVAILAYFIVEAEFHPGIYLLAVLLAAVTTYLWLRNPVLLGESRAKDVIRTGSYALPLSMFALLLIPLLNAGSEYPSNQASDYHLPLVAAVGLLIVVLALELIQFTGLGIALRSRATLLLAVSTALVFAPSLWTPGIPAAMLVLLLGYWRGSRVLMGIAAGFLCLFVVQFYYALDITLLVKSYMMVITGLVLLGLRYVLASEVHLWREGR